MGITPPDPEVIDFAWMAKAVDLAKHAATLGEVPVGAVIITADGLSAVTKHALIGEGHNRMITDHDPSAHAEIIALRHAARTVENYRLPGTTLYTTLEPCAMCAGAIVQARVARVVFAATDPRSGAGGSVFNVLSSEHLNHRAEIVSGVKAQQSGELLRQFFAERR